MEKANCLLQFNRNLDLLPQGFLPAKSISELFPDPQPLTFLTNTLMKPKRFEEQKISEHRNEGVSTVASTDAQQGLSQNEKALQSIVSTVKTGNYRRVKSLQTKNRNTNMNHSSSVTSTHSTLTSLLT